MTTTLPDCNTDSLEDLDFSPTCEIEWQMGIRSEPVPCDNPAKFLISFYAHTHDEIRTKLCCDSCFGELKVHDLMCLYCQNNGGIIKSFKPL